MKNNMKASEYYKSGRHSENAAKAIKLASIAGAKKAEIIRNKAIEEYYSNPIKCRICLTNLSFKQRNQNFCSSSCSAKYNNAHRSPIVYRVVKVKCVDCSIEIEKYVHGPKEHMRCDECKERRGKKIVEDRRLREKQETTTGIRTTNRKIYKSVCKICEDDFETFSKVQVTCKSRECKTAASTGQRTYQNGSRKPVWYFNKFENKEVLLDSSWEVQIADLLTNQNIHWIRPKYIKWIDLIGTERLYYPDFYLKDFNLYLDPKNPFCMSKDVEKMAIVSKLINIVYGPLELVKETVNNLNVIKF